MAVYYNPWSHPVGLLLVCLTIILAGFALYFLDSRLALRKSGLSVKGRRKAALIISIATAPYVLADSDVSFLLISQPAYHSVFCSISACEICILIFPI